jgi:hypothetical protein
MTPRVLQDGYAGSVMEFDDVRAVESGLPFFEHFAGLAAGRHWPEVVGVEYHFHTYEHS